MTFGETSIHQGGLFRCCLASVQREVDHASGCNVLPGTAHVTDCCNEHVELHQDGVWRWKPTGFVQGGHGGE